MGLLVIGGVSIVSSADPCSQVCDEIAGACGPSGSRCVDEVCTDLFWRGPNLCNSSIQGCPDNDPLACIFARIMMEVDDHLGVVALAPRFESDLAFAPGRSVGRRGFQHVDSTTSLLSSVLQVGLHSRALRSAIVDELQLGTDPLDHAAVFSPTLALLNRMYDDEASAASEELLNVGSAFKHAIGEFAELETLDGNLPYRVLSAFMNGLAQVSERLKTALTLDARSIFGPWSASRAAEFVEFPLSVSHQSRWSIKDMLVVNFHDPQEYLGEKGGITELPELLSIAITRYRDYTTERINAYVETPIEIDFSGIMEDGEMHRFRLVGIVREISGKYVADYFDADTNEWIHANDSHLHVIQGQPRNGGSDAVMVFYERL